MSAHPHNLREALASMVPATPDYTFEDEPEPEVFDVPVAADGFTNYRLTLYPDGERSLLYTYPNGRRAGLSEVPDYLVALVKTAAGRL